MSFAQEYLNLTEKYAKLSQDIRKFDIQSIFGRSITQEDSPKGLIYDLNYALDGGYERTYLSYYADDGSEEYYIDDLIYVNCDSSWVDDLQGCFNRFAFTLVTNAYEDATEELVSDMIADDSRNTSLILGAFYLAVIEDLCSQAHAAYAALKALYPNEPFYPSHLVLDTDELTHYESSRCW